MKARTLLCGAILLLAAGGVAHAETCAGVQSAVKLTVVVTGATPIKGEVAVTVYPDNPRRFLTAKGKLGRQRVEAAEPSSACFWLPAAGYYAVAVYHDANADRDFNRSLIGLPTEGFGFSNDAPTKVGLPPFSAVRFKVDGPETTIRVKMRYLG